MSSLAFLPLEIFIVVLIIERIVDQSQRKVKLQKLNMVLGAFFNDVGNHLLHSLLDNFDNKAEISRHLDLKDSWGKKEFQAAADYADKLKIEIDHHDMNLAELKVFFAQKREFLMTLLGNPRPLEHDHFTDFAGGRSPTWMKGTNPGIRWKTCPNPTSSILPAISKRSLYGRLVVEWLDYMSICTPTTASSIP